MLMILHPGKRADPVDFRVDAVDIALCSLCFGAAAAAVAGNGAAAEHCATSLAGVIDAVADLARNDRAYAAFLADLASRFERRQHRLTRELAAAPAAETRAHLVAIAGVRHRLVRSIDRHAHWAVRN